MISFTVYRLQESTWNKHCWSLFFFFFGSRILVFQRPWSRNLRGAQLLRRSEDITTQKGTRKKARKSTLDVRNSLKVSSNYWNPFLFLPSDRLAAWILERVPPAPFPLPRPRPGDKADIRCKSPQCQEPLHPTQQFSLINSSVPIGDHPSHSLYQKNPEY